MKLVFILIILLAGCAAPNADGTSSHERIYSPAERAIRMAICLSRITPENDEIWFVGESPSFIEELKEKSGISAIRPNNTSRYDKHKERPVDQHTGETGFNFIISNVEISGDTARASVSWYASPMGGEWSTVILRKQNDHWLVVEWKLDAAA